MNILGPEFKRQIWLRFSPFSLAIVPILLFCVFGLSYTAHLVHVEAIELERALRGQQDLMFSDPHWTNKTLFLLPISLFLALYVYGALEASGSFTKELGNKTWDWKKTSAIHPLHLVVGKLLGTTSYVWYVAAWLIVGVLVTYGHMFEGQGARIVIDEPIPRSAYPDFMDMVKLVFVIVVPAFFIQLFAVYGSLQNLAFKRKGTFMSAVVAFCGGLYLHNFLVSLLDIKIYSSLASQATSALGQMTTIEWFSLTLSWNEFVLWTLGYALVCVCIALYRLTRKELNFQSYPFVFLAFLTSLSIVWAGLMNDEAQTFSSFKPYIPVFVIFFIASYKMILYSSSDISAYQRFVVALKQKNPKRVLETLPVWFLTLPVPIISVVMWATLSGNDFNLNAFTFLVSLILFMVRDGIVQHILLLGNRYKRGGMMLLFYYLFVYFIFPYLTISNLQIASVLDYKILFDDVNQQEVLSYVSLFFPTAQQNLYAAFLPVLVQTVIAAAILWRVIHPYRIKTDSAA